MNDKIALMLSHTNIIKTTNFLHICDYVQIITHNLNLANKYNQIYNATKG